MRIVESADGTAVAVRTLAAEAVVGHSFAEEVVHQVVAGNTGLVADHNLVPGEVRILPAVGSLVVGRSL